ncbi:MAG: FliH/SctL family protein [Desulfobaccales bacterium]
MSSSDPALVDPEGVEEFRLPDLGDMGEPLPLRSPHFTPWEYGDPADEDSPSEEKKLSPEEVLAAAHLKAQEIEQQAYEEGFRQGQQDGQEVGRRALDEVVKRLQDLVTGLAQERESLFRQRENLLVELVLAICEKLLAQELSLHPEAIRRLIEEGFRHLGHQEGLKVVISPPDYDILRQQNLDSWPPEVELRVDSSITPGGFRLETCLGEIDGTRETRWAVVVHAVRQAVEACYASDAAD